MRFFRIPAFTGIETHRDDADRGSLRIVEGCVPHGPGGLRSGPVWEKVGDVDLFSDSNNSQSHMTASDDGKGNSLVYVSRAGDVHDMAVFSTENTELGTLGATYAAAAPTPYNEEAAITPIGNRLYAMGDGTVEAAYVGKGPPIATASVFPDEVLYDQEWSRFPSCKFYVQGPKKTIFASGNPAKPLTVYISEPAGLTNPYRDSPHSTELTNHNPGVLSTVDILSSNASKITALSTRGDQVVVHTDKGCHLLYSPQSDQAGTGYRTEQVPATNFSGAVNVQVVAGESGTQPFWLGHDGQIYKDEAASRGAEDFKSYSDPKQASWKAKGQWEKELPVDLSSSFATYDPLSGMYWIYVESDEYKEFTENDAPNAPFHLRASPANAETPITLTAVPEDVEIPISLSALPENADAPESLVALPENAEAPENLSALPENAGAPESLSALPENAEAPESLVALAEDVEAPESLSAFSEVLTPESLIATAESVLSPDSLVASAAQVLEPISLTANAESVLAPESLIANAPAVLVPMSLTATAESVLAPTALTAGTLGASPPISLTALAESVLAPDNLNASVSTNEPISLVATPAAVLTPENLSASASVISAPISLVAIAQAATPENLTAATPVNTPISLVAQAESVLVPDNLIAIADAATPISLTAEPLPVQTPENLLANPVHAEKPINLQALGAVIKPQNLVAGGGFIEVPQNLVAAAPAVFADYRSDTNTNPTPMYVLLQHYVTFPTSISGNHQLFRDNNSGSASVIAPPATDPELNAIPWSSLGTNAIDYFYKNNSSTGDYITRKTRDIKNTSEDFYVYWLKMKWGGLRDWDDMGTTSDSTGRKTWKSNITGTYPSWYLYKESGTNWVDGSALWLIADANGNYRFRYLENAQIETTQTNAGYQTQWMSSTSTFTESSAFEEHTITGTLQPIKKIWLTTDPKQPTLTSEFMFANEPQKISYVDSSGTTQNVDIS